ncbi:MAG: Ku protein [Armatimonadota bacterium]|nr:Ku protein [Armatimonadota bacterium]MDR7400871.1 Ku protein [Armatimonadota bacterium]MDR7404215.1 Ku protein [Armatimonadota bacterium]MDR7437828.1 Ku protein [Armatimonadota bacterium]MDR7473153.1 Ku protein [Armatimonadota bacterium]
MRPIWKGHLTFGLVTIPVRLYTATEPKDVRFRLLHRSCLTPIQNRRYCPHHDQLVEWNDVVRGYEYAKGRFVPVTDEDLESIPLETARTVAVTSFADPSEIDPLYYEKSYYLAPDEGGQKAFRLLHDALVDTGRVAVGKVVIKDKEHLVAVRPYDGALVMTTLYYADEVRRVADIPDLPVQVKIHPNEKKMALQLIEGLAAPFSSAEYRDEYREALQKLIAAKVEGQPVAAPAARGPEKVVDLMEALRRSLQLTRREKPAARRPRSTAARAAALRERHR